MPLKDNIFCGIIAGLIIAVMLLCVRTGKQTDLIAANNASKKILQYEIDSLAGAQKSKDDSLRAGLKREAQMQFALSVIDLANKKILSKIHTYAKADYAYLPADSQLLLFADKAARHRSGCTP